LVSDFWPHGEIAKKYGIFNEKLGRSDRSLFVVDKQGIVRWIKLYEPGVLPDNAELLAELKKLKS
jgi:mycoredoxin-dependent peroxiredoxin